MNRLTINIKILEHLSCVLLYASKSNEFIESYLPMIEAIQYDIGIQTVDVLAVSCDE